METQRSNVAQEVEADKDLMSKLWPVVKLLNGLSDQNFLWQSCTGRRDYVDMFGVSIPQGQQHFRKGEASVYCEPVRLSAESMHKFLLTLFKMNREGMKLAEKVNALRLEELREVADRAFSK